VLTYKYKPLGVSSTRTVRLLKLHASGNDQLSCSIKHVKLRKAKYQALSYVWGAPEKPFRIHVTNDHDKTLGYLPLTANLNNALRDLREAGDVNEKVFWIDQSDDDEKGVQVGMMGDIYENATRVITYLGPEQPNGSEAIELIMRLHRHFEPNYEKLVVPNWNVFRYDLSLLPVQEMPVDR
jgi:hypothetical protein